MTETASLPVAPKASTVRHAITAVTTLMAVLLYLDRFAVGIATGYIREDLRMSQAEMSWFLSAFFYSYALGQVPAGWFSDRFGARRILTLYILAWSLFTGLMGFALQVWLILLCRLFCGLSQAGAYPTAGGLIRVWFPLSKRGVASAIVALGGRVGGFLAPVLTAWLILHFSRDADPAVFDRSNIVNDRSFVLAFQPVKDQPQAPIVQLLRARFSPDIRAAVDNEITALQSSPKAEAAPNSKFGPEQWSTLVEQMAALIRSPELCRGLDLTKLKLEPEAQTLAQQQAEGTTLTNPDAIRLNRFVIETTFRGSVKQFRGVGWRPTMIAYGLLGIAVAVAFYIVTRDLPLLHPWCNDAERQLIDNEPNSNTVAVEKPPFPTRAILTDVSLWGNSLMQAFTNIGWVFVVTWLPLYLEEVHGVPLKWRALMTAIPTGVGILGMYAGGWWTDLATQHYGRKWGRRLPILATRLTAGLGYAICLVLSVGVAPGPSWLPWAYVAALSLMAFSVDMGNPAVWGYAQDVGGKYTGSILGWANMWGNLGAAVASQIYNVILGEHPKIFDWSMMFGVCVLAFVLSGVCALVMDSTKPLVEN